MSTTASPARRLAGYRYRRRLDRLHILERRPAMHRALRPRYKGPDAKTIGPTFAAVIDALARALVDAAQTLFRLRAAPRTLPVPEVGGTRWIRS